MKEIPSNTFCSMAWNHQFLGPNGDIKPCCRYTMPKNAKKENIKNDKTLRQVFYSHIQKSLRNDMLQGKRHEGCIKCWQEEDSGKKLSLRQNYNRNVPLLEELHNDLDINNPKITWLELSFSNMCNLRCRMCGPYFSTNWYKDWIDVKDFTIGFPGITTKEEIKDFVSKSNSQLMIDISKFDEILPNIRHLKMTGGEPFIIKEYREILKKIIEIGTAKNVYLNYSTNLTIMPDDELIKIWSHFKQVQIATSLDGVGKVIEYQRYPTKWKQIKNVTKKIMQLSHELPLEIGSRPTITIYNILNVPEITFWWKDMLDTYNIKKFDENTWLNHTHAASPSFLSITSLPVWAKEIVSDKLSTTAPSLKQQKSWEHLIKYCKSNDTWKDNKEKFIKYTSTLDKKRSEDFLNIVPEFSNLMRG